MRCVSYSFSDKLDLSRFERHLKIRGIKVERFPYALKLVDTSNHTLCHFFANGSLVLWSRRKPNPTHYIQLAEPFAENVVVNPIKDSFQYTLGEKPAITTHEYFNVEILTIDEASDEVKLGLAFGFSQSIKLKHFEHVLESLITQYTPLIQQLASEGKIAQSRKVVHQIIAQIVFTKSQLNLSSDFFYPPKFFWQYPSLEPYYLMLHKYLDIPDRIRAVNQKIDTLNETFMMFNSYQETRHSHYLEIIIIVLIAVEIIFSLLNFHL